MSEVSNSWDDAELLGLREDVEIEEIEAELERLKEIKKASLPRCGHVNAHSRGVDGKPDDLACTLHVGHEGNHKSMHKRLDVHGTNEVIEYETEWSDAAGADWPKYEPPDPKWTDGQHQVEVDGQVEGVVWREGVPGVNN